MKKIFSLIIPCLVLLFALPVFAAEPTRTPTRNPRQEFVNKLAAIRDEKKKAIVARIDQQIVKLNSGRTSTMLRHLDTIQGVLDKLKTKTQDLANDGKDVTAINAAITKAQAAIDSARTAITVQAGKTYTINITTDANLGSAVSNTRLAFARDLKTVHQAVVTARKATKDVLVAIAKVVGEKLQETEAD